jgi:hypothetical protein
MFLILFDTFYILKTDVFIHECAFKIQQFTANDCAYFKGLGWVSLRWSQVYVKTRGKIDYIVIFPGGNSTI